MWNYWMIDCRIPVKNSDSIVNISMSVQTATFASGSQFKGNKQREKNSFRLVGSRILNYINLNKEHLDKIHKA